MKRTTIYFDDALLADLRKRARRQGVSYATLVREALTQYLAEPAGGSRLPSIAGKFTSGHTDTASRVDDLLWRDPRP